VEKAGHGWTTMFPTKSSRAKCACASVSSESRYSAATGGRSAPSSMVRVNVPGACRNRQRLDYAGSDAVIVVDEIPASVGNGAWHLSRRRL
jgi:hypothetical protein